MNMPPSKTAVSTTIVTPESNGNISIFLPWRITLKTALMSFQLRTIVPDTEIPD